MVPEQREQRLVRREAHGPRPRDGQAAVGVRSRDPGRVAPGQHAIPAGQQLVGRVQAAQEGVAVIQAVEGGGEQVAGAGPPPLAVAVQELEAPRPGQVPAAPAQVVARAQGVGGEREAAQVADVLEAVAGIAVEAEDGVRNPEAELVAGGGRELGAHQHEHALVVPLEWLGVEVVVVGDGDEAETRPAGGLDHLYRSASAVGERGVDVDDAGDAGVAVAGGLPHDLERTPEGDPQGEDAESEERGQGQQPARPPSQLGPLLPGGEVVLLLRGQLVDGDSHG